MAAIPQRGLAWSCAALLLAVVVTGLLFLSHASSWVAAAGAGHGVHNSGVLEADVKSAFRHAYTFRPPSGSVVVIASTAEARLTGSELHARAKQADQRFKATFSFQELLGRLRDKKDEGAELRN